MRIQGGDRPQDRHDGDGKGVLFRRHLDQVRELHLRASPRHPRSTATKLDTPARAVCFRWTAFNHGQRLGCSISDRLVCEVFGQAAYAHFVDEAHAVAGFDEDKEAREIEERVPLHPHHHPRNVPAQTPPAQTGSELHTCCCCCCIEDTDRRTT